jgi:hypothetical protein
MIGTSAHGIRQRRRARFSDSLIAASWGVSEPQLEAKLDDAMTAAGSSDLADVGS